MYLLKNFDGASELFKDLHENYPEDKSFDRMLHTCLDFKEVPPPEGWDGTYTHKSK